MKLTRTQREHYNHTKETLPVGEAVIIMDFVGFEFTQGKCQIKYVNDLVVVIEHWEVVDGGEKVWKRQYLDFFCDNPGSEDNNDSGRNDSHFLRAVFNHLLDQGVLARFTAIHLFSDNAGKHFKNRHAMRYMALVVLACVQEYGL